MIPYGKQNISQADIDAVVEVLRSDWITQGPTVKRFEDQITAYTGAKHACAVNSATSALHIACLALGLGEGDILWTSPNSFVASANCGLYCGASVDFVDIDPDTTNMSVSALEQKLLQAQSAGRLPKVVIPVHFGGESCDMKAIHALSQQYGFRIIEDASHAIGARYDGKPVGDCRYSDITVFSFHPVKIITTGEGGVATTADDELAASLHRLRTHGITRDEGLYDVPADGPWDYRQVELGLNYRITDFQCALGASQMLRLDEFVARRQQLAERYDRLLADVAVNTPVRSDNAYSALHLYPVRLQVDDAARRRVVFDRMRASGIGVNVHYIPIHTQPYYRQLGFSDGDFPHAEAWYRNCMSLPMFFDLTDSEQDQVVDTLREAIA